MTVYPRSLNALTSKAVAFGCHAVTQRFVAIPNMQQPELGQRNSYNFWFWMRRAWIDKACGDSIVFVDETECVKLFWLLKHNDIWHIRASFLCF